VKPFPQEGKKMILSGIADEAGKTIEEQIEAHRKLGWNHIEIRNVSSVNLTRVSESDFEKIRGKLNEAGMQVSCLGSEIANWARKISGDFKTDEEDLKRAIPRMKKLNTKYIRVMSYPNDGMGESEWHEEVLKRMKELTNIAEGEGIILAHENCSGWGGVSAENCRTLTEEIGSASFRVLFDTGNPPAEGQDSWDFYNTVRKYIVYVHIKDSRREGE
jgi:sugar phosphate isomerase/epimerase